MASIVEASSFFDIDMELDSLLEQMEEQVFDPGSMVNRIGEPMCTDLFENARFSQSIQEPAATPVVRDRPAPFMGACLRYQIPNVVSKPSEKSVEVLRETNAIDYALVTVAQ